MVSQFKRVQSILCIAVYVKKDVLQQIFWGLTLHFEETSDLELSPQLLNLVLNIFPLCDEQSPLEYVVCD